MTLTEAACLPGKHYFQDLVNVAFEVFLYRSHDISVWCTRSSEKAAGSCWDVSSNSSGAPSYERSISESDKGERGRSSLNEKVRALSLDLDKQPGAQGLTGTVSRTVLKLYR